MLKIFLLSSLASWPLLSLAQTTPRTTIFYAGAKLSLQTGQPFNAYRSAQFGPALTVGAQFSPRVAVQLSSAYTWRHDTYHGTYNANGQAVVEDSDTRLHTFTVPILLRYTLTNPSSRWHVDALAGPTLLFYATHQVFLQTTQGQVTRSSTSNNVDTQTELTLGPSVRYALTPRLELVADALASLYVSSLPYGAPLSSQLSSHVLVGVQYCFGQ